ncbi:MAG: hypothetical protein ACK5CE_01155 [Actinomycetes bacterium]
MRNVPPAIAETALPAEGRQGPPPPLPPLKDWHPRTVEAWAAWWATPQALLWDQDGKTMHRWALLYDVLVTDPVAPPSVHAQLLQVEDRHGMSPQAMAKLRWAVRASEPEPPVEVPKAKTDRRKRVLEAVSDASA